MKHLFFLILCCFSPVGDLLCQQLITDDYINLKRGIYKNFQEFKYNNPSITIDFSIEEKERRKFQMLEGKEYVQYRLTLNEKLPIKEDSIWGFCDGTDVYIQGIEFGKNNYEKLQYIGRYCCYYQFQPASPGVLPTGLLMGAHNSRIIPKAINFNNGTDFLLNDKSLKLILEKAPDLLKEFKSDKSFNKDYFYYIRKYSASHVNEIKH